MRAVAGLGAFVALVAAGCGGETAALPQGRALAATWSITPPVALFGDPITARIDLVVDGDMLDPDRLKLEPKFDPYERLGDVRRGRRDFGRYTHLTYEFTLRCITLACIELIGGGPGPGIQPGGIPPPTTGSGGFGERKSIRIDPAPIRYEDEDGKTRVLRRVTWPELQSVSRLNLADTQTTGIGFPFRAAVTPLPEATFRVAPSLLGAALLAGALALLAFPVVMVARALRREAPPVEEDKLRELTPLERALALVEWAREREDGADRRKALEALAEVLDDDGKDELAHSTRALAWSAASPSPEAADRLVEDVRKADGSAV